MKLFQIAGAFVVLLGLGLQYWVSLQVNAPAGVWLLTVNYFSYFTVISNILVVAALLWPSGFFAKNTVRAAIALYITVTGTIYFLLLRNQWNPQGWHLVADSILHYASPVIFLIDCFVFKGLKTLQSRDIPKLMIFPACFGIYSILRGAVVGHYPYPFLDVNELGYPKVLLNCLLMTLTFGVLGMGIMALSRTMKKGTASDAVPKFH